jgi:hypothetical protein
MAGTDVPRTPPTSWDDYDAAPGATHHYLHAPFVPAQLDGQLALPLELEGPGDRG